MHENIRTKDYSITNGGLLTINGIEFINLHDYFYDEDGVANIKNPISNWRFFIYHCDDLTEKLNIDVVEFRNILIKYGAKKIHINKWYPHELGFLSIEDCVKFVNSEELLKHLVMGKLVSD